MMQNQDPYELKLYQMFQSCDDGCGELNEESLWRLCELLELRDKGALLVSNLAADGTEVRVTFDCFKEALLNFLGTELDENKDSTSTQSYKEPLNAGNKTDVIRERSLIISDDVETYIDTPPDTSDREVSPKLVVGSKKYGRRSRPQTNGLDNLSESDSENEDKSSQSPVQRSSSHTDIPGNRRRRPAAFSGSKLKRCSSLPAQRNLQAPATNKLTNFIKSKTFTSNQTLPQPLSQDAKEHNSMESLNLSVQKETLSADSIVAMWEQANINNGKGILSALGFDEDEVNLTQLNKVLEEELRSLEDEQQLPLLRAQIALQSTELSSLRQAYRQLHDENMKLRTDNKDANRRAALLAAEIDERHASLEDSSKKEIRLLEQRHAGIVRDLTARMAKDRENWTNLTTRLEEQIKSLEQDEIRFKTDLELIQKENSCLELEHQKLQKQVTVLLEKNVQLNREILNLEDSARVEEHNRTDMKNSENEMVRLVEKVAELQLENKNLRDKNDELVVEIENLNMDLTRLKVKCKKSSNVAQETEDSVVEGVAESTNSMATKRRGDSPSKTRISEESPPRLGKLRKCTNESGISENSDTSGEWMALNSELQKSDIATSPIAAIDSEKATVDTLTQKVSELEDQLKTTQQCLEQMQGAYEDCEEYWHTKLSEERQLYEKERMIYEDEQQESDRKFTELMEKVREYEEQFSKDGRLSPIEEKDTLEQQYAELETEVEQLRENACQIFEEKSKEISVLQNEIEDLKLRLGESEEILTGACELNTASQLNTNTENAANSPISYLWHQSTIQEPAKPYEKLENAPITVMIPSPNKQKETNRLNLSTSETSIFSTKPMDTASNNSSQTVSPIQKPGNCKAVPSEGDVADCDTSSTTSGKSFETHSVASTHSVHRTQLKNAPHIYSSGENSCSSPSGIKEELKRLKFFEMSLKEQIKDLSFQRDGVVMELQQLQEARPVLEKAYARTAHPSLMQRVNQLEMKNRHLQNVIKQQQHYTDSLMQESWRQHQMVLADLHSKIEGQGILITEQAQRLQNADVLVKDLYVENAHLTATVQQLTLQQARTTILQQTRQGLHGLPGMP